MTSKRKNGHFNISFIFLCKILLFLFIIWSTYYYFSRKKLLLFYNWDADKIKKKREILVALSVTGLLPARHWLMQRGFPEGIQISMKAAGTPILKKYFIYICMLGQKYLKLIACQQKVSNSKIWLHVSIFNFCFLWLFIF